MSTGDEIALVGLLLTIIGSLWAFVLWHGRPWFICGVPPSKDEQAKNPELRKRLGAFSVAAGFRHRPDCFAARLRDRPELTDGERRRHLNDPLRSRTVNATASGAAQIPVVLENRGGRVARDYFASIAFLAERGEPFIQITDVLTESLDVTSIYSGTPTKVVPRLRERTAPAGIVAAYDDYLSHAPSWGDGAFLSGTLEAGMHELITIIVEVPAEVSAFMIVFNLDCADGWLRAQHRIQGCRVVRDGPRPAAPEATSNAT